MNTEVPPDNLELAPILSTRESKLQGNAVELLSFTLGEQLFAVALEHVREIVVPPPITRVPRSKNFISGICSVRGELVTVIDLSKLLDLAPSETAHRGRILLGPDRDNLVGLRVDDVRQVVRLHPKEIESTSQTLGGDLSDAVLGIGRPQSGEVLVLLDLSQLITRGNT